MEAAIRWSANSSSEVQRFLIADVAGNSLRYCEAQQLKNNELSYKQISKRDKLPNFTAFDWCRNDESLVALGTAAGEARIIQIDSLENKPDFLQSFPVRLQRKCNSIAWGSKDLLATGLDRARNDSSLNIYDTRTLSSSTQAEPLRKFSITEGVTNVKFFADQPDVILAGISRQCIRIYDLRGKWLNCSRQCYADRLLDNVGGGPVAFPTRHVHYLSIDPLDQNYFASVGAAGENVVSVWDRRAVARSSAASLSDSPLATAVLEIKPVVISTQNQANIWSLRYSGYRRGSFAVLSSAGQIRLFDTARYPISFEDDFASSTYLPSNLADNSVYVVKKSHDLQHPWNDRHHGQLEQNRPIAFDFAGPGSLSGRECILSIKQNRRLEVIEIPLAPSSVCVTALNDLTIHTETSRVITAKHSRTIAESLMVIQGKNLPLAQLMNPSHPQQTSVEGHADSSSRTFTSDLTITSSRDRHEALLSLPAANASHDIEELLTVLDTSRQRCLEGYLFDCELNKSIVKNDPWLVQFWDDIKIMEDMAANNGMMHETLDLSYLGVHAIWNGQTGSNPSRVLRRGSATAADFTSAANVILQRQRYDEFQGVQTKFPERRQLGLIICGYRFDEKRLRGKCGELLGRREYYKAIVVAVYHGRRDIAIDLLRSLTKTKTLDNSGLGAVIACETVSKEQRELCEWMAEEAEDPYLRALLAYFVSGDWYSVVTMKELPLVRRVAVALKFLDDVRLDQFLDESIADSIAYGDIEGIILTGLAEQSMDLLQKYIARFNDLQTAVLATSLANPRYVNDGRFEHWKETYFLHMQSWKAFMERTRFTVQHNRKAIGRDGQRLIAPPPRQVTLRCNYCKESLARNDLNAKPQKTGMPGGPMSGVANNPLIASGTICPKCGRPMPRCSICMLWLGTPDPAKPPGAAALEDDDPLSKFVNFCMACNHGSHAHHARDWFAKHQMCPVPDCSCLCAMRR